MTLSRRLMNIPWRRGRLLLLFALTLPVLVLMEINIDRLARGVDQPLYYSARLDEISKMDLEATILFEVAEGVAAGGGRHDKQDVLLHFDVLWGRIDATRTPSYMAVLGAANVDPSLALELYAALPEFEAAVNALEPGRPESVRPLLALRDRFAERLHRINEAAWATRRKVAAEFAGRNAANVAVLRNIQIGFTVLSLFLLFYMLFELVSARRANRGLNSMIAEKQALLRTDLLTGICNRSAFEADLAMRCALPHEEAFSVVYLDLDGFKKVNDTLGHAAGDGLLRHIAGILRDATDANDFVSRLGGDEFAVILRGPLARATAVMDDVLRQIGAAPILDSGVTISGSVGLCHTDECAARAVCRMPEAMMRAADLALYSAKNDGRNRMVIFSRDLSQRHEWQTRLEALLPSAIRAGAIDAAFQPIVDLKNGDVAFLETLVRWSSPELGPVQADQIVAIAERTGCILDLTLAMLRRALAVSAAVERLGRSIPITVNLPPALLALPDFAVDVVALFAREGVRPGAICFELVEYADLDEMQSDVVRLNLDCLMRAGIPLAIDDFGKAYSNVHRLIQIEFQVLKLDKVLLSGIGETGRATRILHGLNRLMEAIGVDVVGEGIETQKQIDLLREAGIRYAQGYFFARPMFEDTLLDFLRAGMETDCGNARRIGA